MKEEHMTSNGVIEGVLGSALGGMDRAYGALSGGHARSDIR